MDKLKWDDELHREGDLSITTNVMSDSFTIKGDGDYHYNSTINGEVFETTIKGEPTILNIKFKKSPVLISYENKGIESKEYFNKVIKNLTSFEFKAGKNSGYNPDTNGLLYSSDGAFIKYSIKEAGDGNGKVEFILQAQNTKYEKEFDKIYGKMLLLMTGEKPRDEYFSHKGKMNADIHLIYDGGMFIKDSKLSKDISFVFKFPKFTVYDELSIMRLNGEVSVDKEDGKLKSSVIKYIGELQYKEQWYARLLADVEDFRKLIINGIKDGSALKSYPMLNVMVKDLKEKTESSMSDEDFMIDFANKLFDNVDMIIPKFHEWGKIDHAMDVVYNDTDGQKIDINKFDLVINPSSGSQGIKLVGSASKNKSQSIFNISLSLLNYSNLVDDIYAYAMNGVRFNEDILQNEPTFEIKKGLDNAIKKALLKLSGSTDVAAKDITIIAKTDKENPMPMIGNMPIFQAMGVLQNLALYIAPIIPDDEYNGSTGGRRPLNYRKGAPQQRQFNQVE